MAHAIAYTIFENSTIYLNSSFWGQYMDDAERQYTLMHEVISHGILNMSHAEAAERLGIKYEKPPMPPVVVNIPFFTSPQQRERIQKRAEAEAKREYERPGGLLDSAASAAIDKWIANGCQN